MKIYQYGKVEAPIIIVLHPMFLNSQGMKELIIDNFKGEYHFICPDLSGHGKDTGDFLSPKYEAEYFTDYLLEKDYKNISLVLGFSIGAIVGLELYSLRGDIDYN